MGEVLKGVPECVEATLGEALRARTDAQSHFVGLGPPDLCCVLKAFEPSLGGGLRAALKGSADMRRGSWHSVVGLDVTSAAAISAYLSDLSHRQEPAAWLAGGEWRIVGGTYAAWDAFARRDVRVEISIPGGVTAYSVDAADVRAPVSAAQWRQLGVSGVLRSLCAPPVDSTLQVLPSMLTLEREADFLESCLAIAAYGLDISLQPPPYPPVASPRVPANCKPARPAGGGGDGGEGEEGEEGEGSEAGGGKGSSAATDAAAAAAEPASATASAAAPKKILLPGAATGAGADEAALAGTPAAVAAARELGVLGALLWAHFARQNRYTQAASFFSALLPFRPACGALVAEARGRAGDGEAAMEELCAALERHPDSLPLIRAQAALAISLPLPAEALALASAALSLAPREPNHWLVAARAYLANGAPELCLLALNATPMRSAAATVAPLPLPAAPREPAAAAAGAGSGGAGATGLGLALLPCAPMPTPERITTGEPYTAPVARSLADAEAAAATARGGDGGGSREEEEDDDDEDEGEEGADGAGPLEPTIALLPPSLVLPAEHLFPYPTRFSPGPHHALSHAFNPAYSSAFPTLPLDSAHSGAVAGSALTTAAAYSVLAEAAAAVGWDRLLQAREHVFAPAAVVAAADAAAAEAAAARVAAGGNGGEGEEEGKAGGVPQAGSCGGGGGHGGARRAALAPAADPLLLPPSPPTSALPASPAELSASLRGAAAATAGGRRLVGGKRVCRAWLDKLFGVLLADLQALTDWQAEEEEEAAEAEAAKARGQEPPEREGADFREWYARARLALRLHQPEAAVDALERCIGAVEAALEEFENCGTPPEAVPQQLHDLHLTATANLLALYTEQRDGLAPALQLCAALAELHAASAPAASAASSAGGASTVAVGIAGGPRSLATAPAVSRTLPAEVSTAVYRMASLHGLKAVRAAVGALAAHGASGMPLRATFSVLCDEVAHWQANGHDR